MAIIALPISHSELLTNIAGRTARAGVIGLVYVGLPLTLLFNGKRFPVTGFDIDGSPHQISRHVAAQRITRTVS